MAIDRRFAAVLAAAVVVGVSAGAVAQPMTAVTQLGWLRIGEYGPIIVADVKGFFADEGIDHKIVDGGPGKNPIPIVAVGQAQFGLATNGMYLVSARLAKDPVDVVMVGKMDFFLAWIVNQTYQIEQESAKPDAPPTVKGKTWRALRMSEWGIGS